jgi:hypothetical protein
VQELPDLVECRVHLVVVAIQRVLNLYAGTHTKRTRTHTSR